MQQVGSPGEPNQRGTVIQDLQWESRRQCLERVTGDVFGSCLCPEVILIFMHDTHVCEKLCCVEAEDVCRRHQRPCFSKHSSV